MSTSRNAVSSFLLNRSTAEEQDPEAGGSVFLLFHGLMCFAYNNTTHLCEVGIHSKAAEHDFKIFAFQLDRESPILPPPIYRFEPDSHNDVPGGVVTVEIEDPINPGIHYHLPGTEDDYTWDQLLDLEGRDFYDRKLEKNKNVLKPKITINHGLFYVFPTTRNFRKIEENNPGNSAELGTIAYYGVSAVQHENSGTVTLKTQREELTLQGSMERPVLIVFSNSCPQDECSSNASDFPLYYRAFKIKSSEKKYRLEVSDGGRPARLRTASFFFDLFEQEPLRSLRSNNDAPCGVAGYGRSSGIDDSTP